MLTSNNTKKPCCKCNKGGAIFTCDGCHHSFCLKHTSDHRQELSQQMDNIGQEYDTLKRDIDLQDTNNNSLLNKIDQWEEDSISNIRSCAEKARADLKRLNEEAKNQLNEMMKKISDELRSNQKSDEYTEDNITQWTNQLKTLRLELEKLSEIEIEEDKSSSFCLIKMKKLNTDREYTTGLSTQDMVCNVEKFGQEIGPVSLLNDNCLAVCMSDLNIHENDAKYSSVCGHLRYSDSVHNLRFRLNTSCNSSVFLGILSPSQSSVSELAVLGSIYGYWSRGKHVKAGSNNYPYRKIATQPNDIVLFTLGCSSSKIIYVHERTQLRNEMIVDQNICPFPWKLVVILYCLNDQIEILNS